MENESQDIILRQTIHSGPLPSADEFRRYNEALPGAADRLLTQVEKQSEHRRAHEMRELDVRIRLSLGGQICAFIIAILSLVVVGICAFIDRPQVTIVPAIISLTSLAAVFLGQKNTRRGSQH